MDINVKFHQAGSILGPLSGANSLLAFGRAAALLTATTAAATALTRLANYSASSVRQQGFSALGMGGTTTQGLQLRGLGGAAGLGMGELGNIGERLGGSNRSARLLEAVDRLQKISTLEGRLAYLRARGIEELLPLAFLTERQTQLLKREATARRSLFDNQAVQKASSFNFELERTKRIFSDFGTAIGQKVLPNAERVLKIFNDITGGWLDKRTGGASKLDQAADNLNHAAANLKNSVSGTFGGGLRTQGALPAALKGAVLNQALAGGNFFLGDLVP